MRVLTIDESRFVAGGFAENQEQVDQVDDIVVTGNRNVDRTIGWFRDLFGFDSGSFSWSDVGLGGGGHHGYVTGQVGGLGVAIPVDEDGRPMVGIEVGVDIDPTDGTITPSLPNGVNYDPNLEAGLNVDPTSVSYWQPVPTPWGGLGMYPVPGGEYGDYYWGFEPGSPLSPFPNN